MVDIHSLFDSLPDAPKQDIHTQFDALPGAQPQGQQLGAVESGIRGGLQGATLGYGDELTGGIRAGLHEATHPSEASVDDLIEKYRHYRDLERSLNEQAQKQHPGVYTGANIAGGMLGMAAIPEVGLAGPILKTMSPVQKIMQAAKIGAGAGAVSGLGYSGADLSKNQGEQAASDIAGSAGLGAATGGLLQGGAEAIKGAAGAVGRGVISPLLNKFGSGALVNKATQKGLEGTNLTNFPEHLENLNQTTQDIGRDALNTQAAVKEQYANTIENAAKEGKQVSLGNFLSELDQLKDQYSKSKDPEVLKDINRVVNMIKNYTSMEPATPGEQIAGIKPQSKLNPNDLNELQKGIGAEAYSPDSSLGTPQGKSFAKATDTALKGTVNQSIPGIQDVNTKYQAISNALQVLGLDSETALIKNVKTGTLEFTPQALSKMQTFVKNIGTESVGANTAKQALSSVLDNLEAAGLETEGLRSQINTVSENFDLAKSLTGHSTLGHVFGYPVRLTAAAGNVLGQGVNKAANAYEKAFVPLIGGYSQNPEIGEKTKNFTQKTMQFGNNVYKMSKENLSNVANTLMGDPNTQPKGQALQKAIEAGDSQKQNAVIFNLMQSPATRKIITSDQNHLGESEGAEGSSKYHGF